MEGRKRGSELLSNAKGEHVVIAEQAILALFREVHSRIRLSPPSPRTLKELYQAGFNSLNARICRDLLYKWVAIMRNTKGSRYVERPSWWPGNVRYTNAGELDGPEIKAVLFHLFYGEYGYVPLTKFYTAGRGIKMKDIDQKTLSWAFCIRRVFKANIMLRGYPSALDFY
ncbi:hypothetical protein N7527_009189 [Penicillium freii]|nr:hypothetical protein N7527_009189 [Penicillium freii]